jgi:hypothetical protein
MGLERILTLLKRKPKMRPIYVGDQIVGYDDGLPNSININKSQLQAALCKYGRIDHMVPFSWLHEMDKLVYRRSNGQHTMEAVLTKDTYADKAIFTVYGFPQGVSTGGSYLEAREADVATNDRQYYYLRQEPAAATADRKIVKRVSGTETVIATEAADYGDWWQSGVKLQCSGTTIKAFMAYDETNYWWHSPLEDILSTLMVEKLSVTDTSLSSGRFGIANHWDTYHYGHGTTAITYMFSDWVSWEMTFILDAASPSMLEPIAFFEVPVEFFDLPECNEDDTVNISRQFYSVKMPEEIVTVEKPIPQWIQRKVEVLRRKGWSDEEIKAFMPEAFPVERINRLSVTWSALIPTDNKGKPKDSVALVRVFQSTPEYCHPIEKRIQAIEEMRGVRRLKREEAIDLALKMDDKLHIHDLVPCTKHELGGKCFREYREWRIGTVGDKPEFADTDTRKRYVKETKGW